MSDDKSVLPCKHSFCRICIKTWLSTVSTCPYCRNACTICSLCGEPTKIPIIKLSCEHLFCKECMITKLRGECRCPQCWHLVYYYECEGLTTYLDLDLHMGMVIDEDDESWPDEWRNPQLFLLNNDIWE